MLLLWRLDKVKETSQSSGATQVERPVLDTTLVNLESQRENPPQDKGKPEVKLPTSHSQLPKNKKPPKPRIQRQRCLNRAKKENRHTHTHNLSSNSSTQRPAPWEFIVWIQILEVVQKTSSYYLSLNWLQRCVAVQSVSHVQLCDPMNCSMPGSSVLTSSQNLVVAPINVWKGKDKTVWRRAPLLNPQESPKTMSNGQGTLRRRWQSSHKKLPWERHSSKRKVRNYINRPWKASHPGITRGKL